MSIHRHDAHIPHAIRTGKGVFAYLPTRRILTLRCWSKGSHWTLLAGLLQQGERRTAWVHYDSLQGGSGSANARKAADLARALQCLRHGVASIAAVNIRKGRCPQQANAHDCGAHVVAAATALLAARAAGRLSGEVQALHPRMLQICRALAVLLSADPARLLARSLRLKTADSVVGEGSTPQTAAEARRALELDIEALAAAAEEPPE